MATSKTLPPELIALILSNLPVKPLCRFKSVSKSWNSLINSPIFIKLHLSKTLISDNKLIFASYTLSASPIAPVFRFSELHHPLIHFPDYLPFKILGSCNGLICTSTVDKTYPCFYNPSIGTHFWLPLAPSRFPPPSSEPDTLIENQMKGGFHVFAYGFGYDTCTDDYKLLQILQCYKNYVSLGVEVCLFSLKNGAWKFVFQDDLCVNWGDLKNFDCALVDGCLYFIVNDTKNYPMIKCFNLSTEKFSVINFPEFDEDFDMFHIAVRQVGGCLCLLLNSNQQDYNAFLGTRLTQADFWIRKDAAWVRLFRISDPSTIGASTIVKPLLYSKDGRKILLEVDGRVYGWYNWEKKRFRRVLAHGLPPGQPPLETWSYVESLVPLGNANSKGKSVPWKRSKKDGADRFLSSGFKLRL